MQYLHWINDFVLPFGMLINYLSREGGIDIMIIEGINGGWWIIEMGGNMCILAGRASFVAGSSYLLAGRGMIVAGSAVVVAGSRRNFGGRHVAIEMRGSGIRKQFWRM